MRNELVESVWNVNFHIGMTSKSSARSDFPVEVRRSEYGSVIS
jgi:hypothetical protein